jgi:hypothetical protein
MHVRRFSADLKTKIPGGQVGLYGVPIQFDRTNLPTSNLEELAQLVNGLPILLNRPMIVVAIYLEPHGSIYEHSSEVPILLLVTAGSGFVQTCRGAGCTRAVRQAGQSLGRERDRCLNVRICEGCRQRS